MTRNRVQEPNAQIPCDGLGTAMEKAMRHSRIHQRGNHAAVEQVIVTL
jgi:hypothetical protein